MLCQEPTSGPFWRHGEAAEIPDVCYFTYPSLEVIASRAFSFDVSQLAGVNAD